jgi:hypothetical protein
MTRRVSTFPKAVLIFLALSVAVRAGTVLYSDGPINGELEGSLISAYGGNNVPDSLANTFTLSSNATLTGVTFGLWLYPTFTATTLDWTIWNAAGPGGGGSILDSGTGTLSNVFVLANSTIPGGFDVYSSSFSLPSILLDAGTYWLELNQVNSGALAYWDNNSGPSEAWANQWGNETVSNNCGGDPLLEAGLTTCGNSFQITGNVASPVPEPGGLALAGSGLLLLAGAVRRRLHR